MEGRCLCTKLNQISFGVIWNNASYKPKGNRIHKLQNLSLKKSASLFLHLKLLIAGFAHSVRLAIVFIILQFMAQSNS